MDTEQILARIDPAEALDFLAGMVRYKSYSGSVLIRKHIGTESKYLAWPYGERNDEVDRVARSAGFSRVVGMAGGTNEVIPGSRVSRLEINRYGISARTSMHPTIS